MRQARALTRAGLAAAAVALAGGIAAASLAATPLSARWLVLEDPPEAVDAAVVMAGDPDYERTTTASRIVLAGRARLLILTGGESGPGDSAESLRAHSLALGVPGERIRTETTSRSTREAAIAVRGILHRERIRTVDLVTSPYHQRRAYLTARRAWGSGVRVLNRPATPSFWSPEGWWRRPETRRPVLTEYAKLAGYAARGWI